jgi:hypothetical protein
MEGCSTTATLGYLLSNWQNVLDRYTNRDDSCLRVIYDKLLKTEPDDITLYADLEVGLGGMEK